MLAGTPLGVFQQAARGLQFLATPYVSGRPRRGAINPLAVSDPARSDYPDASEESKRGTVELYGRATDFRSLGGGFARRRGTRVRGTQ